MNDRPHTPTKLGTSFRKTLAGPDWHEPVDETHPSRPSAPAAVIPPPSKQKAPALKRPARKIPVGDVSKDRVVVGPSPLDGQYVAVFPAWRLLRIGGTRYAEAGELKRAVTWGELLFGGGSFTVYEGPLGKPESRYLVLPLTETVKTEDMRVTGMVAAGGHRLRVYSGLTEFFVERTDAAKELYGFRAVVALDSSPLFPARPLDVAARFFEDIEGVAPRRQLIPPAMARPLVFKELNDALGTTDATIATLDVSALPTEAISRAGDLLAGLDAHAFELLDATAKARYLEVLIRDWTLSKQETAIVELFKAMKDRKELAAATHVLEEKGVYTQLFNDVDGHLWELLTVVGERFGEPDMFTLPVLLDIILQLSSGSDQGRDVLAALGAAIGYRGPDKPPVVDETLFQELVDAVNALLQFGVSLVEGLWTLLSDPLKIIEGLVQLIELYVEWELAQLGYPPSVLRMQRLVDQVSTTAVNAAVNAFKGAQILGVLDKVATKLRWMIVFEVASWLVGPGEIKAGVRIAVELAEHAVAITRILRALEGIAGLGEAMEVVGKVTRVAELLAHERQMARGENMLRLISHLPKEDVATLARALAAVDPVELRAAKTIAALGGHDAELAAALAKVAKRADALAALEANVGRLSEAMLTAFRRLAGHPQFAEGDTLFKLMATLPPEDAELFARAVNKIPDLRLNARRAPFFANLARHPRQEEFILEHGYEAWRTMNEHAGYDFERTEQYLDAFTRRGTLADQATRDAQAAALAERLANGDETALAELDDIRRAMQRERGVLPSFDDAAIAGWFAQRGGKPSIQEARAFSRTIDSGSRGRLFERWLTDNVFHGQQERLVVNVADNPGIFPSGQMTRTSDFIQLEPGRPSVIWDGKCYTSGRIDEEQLADYASMLDRGSIVERVGAEFKTHQVDGLAYIFSERAAAEEASKTLAINGAESWYIDDAGKLVNLF